MPRFSRSILVLSLLSASALCGSAEAAIFSTANLFAPMLPPGTGNTIIGVQQVGSTPSQTNFCATDLSYCIAFNVPSNEGVVQGTIPSLIHATPVAGITVPGGAPTYLTGDFGSDQTPDVDQSGKYLSTGTGTITITFGRPQLSLALLWGSIDTSNKVTFNNTNQTSDTLTGAQVQAETAFFASNGYQGPGGSAYVVAVSDTTFSSVTFTSGVTSFEFAAVVGSVDNLLTPVPLPASAPLFGAALATLGAAGYGLRRRKTVA